MPQGSRWRDGALTPGEPASPPSNARADIAIMGDGSDLGLAVERFAAFLSMAQLTDSIIDLERSLEGLAGPQVAALVF